MGAVSIEQGTGELPAPGVPADPALAGYTKRMRRLTLIYAAAVAVIVIIVVAWVAVVMAHSEIAHATLHSAKTAAPDIGEQAPSANPRLAWTNSDRLAIGSPLFEGTVITYSGHTVTGRNARTGVATWSYTRTDLSICEVVQEQGYTVAFFNREGNCDEVNAFKTGTGTRAWSRTLDSDGQPIDGIPTFAANEFTITLTTPKRVQAIVATGDDKQGGLDRWNTAAPPGCRDVSSALGTNGVLIQQDCADGTYLQLRDAYAGDKVDNNPNPKLQLWRVHVSGDLLPVSADTIISAYDPALGNLIVYASDGSVLSSTPLASRPSVTTKPVSTPIDSTELIWIDGHQYAVSTSSIKTIWTTPLTGPASPADSQLVAATNDGVRSIDAQTGQFGPTYSVPAPALGTLVLRLGSGFLIGRSSAGGSATAVYL
jgi:hypothetical protein